MRNVIKYSIFSIIWIIILFFSFKYLNTSSNKVKITIKKGESIVDVANLLKEKGIIRDKKTFITLGGITGLDRKIKAGTYIFEKNTRELSVLRILAKGGKYISVTIPEGSRLSEIALIVNKKMGIDTSLFISSITDPEYLRKWNIKSNTPEGFLYPETYYFTGTENSDEIADKMIAQFYKVWDSLVNEVESLPSILDSYGIVIMASLIEAETSDDSEKPLIAGVYYNRLRKGWKLQCDPTILYALGERRKVFYNDLKIKSPYNTYRYRGLPPTPICSPGKFSLYAAMKPAETDYMYFVSNGKKHIFSRTLKEHENNIKKLRRGL